MTSSITYPNMEFKPINHQEDDIKGHLTVILIQMQMTTLDEICFYPTTSFGSNVLAPPPVSSFSWLLLFVSAALPALCIAPPPSSAALKLPFFAPLPPSSGSPRASFLALLSLSELAPAHQDMLSILQVAKGLFLFLNMCMNKTSTIEMCVTIFIYQGLPLRIMRGKERNWKREGRVTGEECWHFISLFVWLDINISKCPIRGILNLCRMRKIEDLRIIFHYPLLPFLSIYYPTNCKIAG